MTQDNVVCFRSKRVMIEDLIRNVAAESKPGQEDLERQLAEHDAWRNGSIPPGWLPTVTELKEASGYAESFYDSAPDGPFEWVDLAQSIEDEHAGSVLNHLNDKQLEKLVAYGEARNWKGLSPVDFKKFVL